MSSNSDNRLRKGAEARWRVSYKTQLPDDANRLNRSGIEIKPIYSPDDWDSERYMDDLGFPGEAPWTRGIYPTMHRGRAWSQRQLIGLATPKQYNERMRKIVAAGATALSVTAFSTTWQPPMRRKPTRLKKPAWRSRKPSLKRLLSRQKPSNLQKYHTSRMPKPTLRPGLKNMSRRPSPRHQRPSCPKRKGTASSGKRPLNLSTPRMAASRRLAVEVFRSLDWKRNGRRMPRCSLP